MARSRLESRDEDNGGRDLFAKMLLLTACETLLDAASRGENISRAQAEQILEWVEMVGQEKEQLSLFGAEVSS